MISNCSSLCNEELSIRVGFLNENIPAVSSLDVARHFQKKHKNILRDIDLFCTQLPEIFIKLNFELNETEVKGGFGIRKERHFLLTRDAFTLLVMGFTGKAALQWKLRYIEAFNTLEAAVRKNIRTDALEAARSLPALECQRKAAYLDGLKEGRKLQKRQDGLRRLVKAHRYTSAGLSQGEVGAALGMSANAVGKLLARARKQGLLEVSHG